MSDWLILVEQPGDLGQAETPHKVMTVGDYLAHPGLFAESRPSIINLARSYAYQSRGYYASLLAEARGHRIVPSVQTMVELSGKALYAQALPELEAALAADLEQAAERPKSLFVTFGKADVAGFEKTSKLLLDWFRAPAIEVVLADEPKVGIKKLRPIPIHTIKVERRAQLVAALDSYTQALWSDPKARIPARWSLAVLVDPQENLPPSDEEALRRLSAVAAKMGVSVQPLHPGDLARLAEHDALFIRATTQIDNFTYRFARRAEQEGMPVIDDTTSMIRCTNKVYLEEILDKAGLPRPKTLILDAKSALDDVGKQLGFPLVLKAPDGSFSRSVHKVSTTEELKARMKSLLADTALVLAQEYMPTQFDWRIVVLGGVPLVACQYEMASGHWQIVKHEADGKFEEGGSQTFRVEDAPKEVVELGVAAARLIGDGLYGIDIKQNDQGLFIIEINDNPNMDQEVEGAVLGDALWEKLIEWYAGRLERKHAAPSPLNDGAGAS